MIYIKETFPDEKSVSIKVDGVLDDGCVPILDNLCQRHLRKGKKVFLELKFLINISRGGVGLLQQIKNKTILIDIPPFINLKSDEPLDRRHTLK